MGFLGMDILAIQHLARQLDTQANEVERAVGDLTQLIQQTEWFGADSRRFQENWGSSQVPELRRAAGLLREASELARLGAKKQDEASRG